MGTNQDKRELFILIDDATGFASGDRFSSTEEVRAYFTVENLCSMFDVAPERVPTQDELTSFADAVIAHRWHMED